MVGLLAPRPLILLLLLPLSVLPSASATHPPCADEADLTADALHVVEQGIRSQLWQEHNALPGLQTVSCHADGLVHPPDTFLGMVPHDLGILGICSFVLVAQCL